MAELVDAPDLGSGGLKPVGVQIPLLVLIGDWRLAIGDWRLAIGDWRLAIKKLLRCHTDCQVLFFFFLFYFLHQHLF